MSKATRIQGAFRGEWVSPMGHVRIFRAGDRWQIVLQNGKDLILSTDEMIDLANAVPYAALDASERQ